MPVSLIGPLDNNHVQRVLMVAAYAGITLKVVPMTEGRENCTEAYRLNISPLMRVPAMKTDEGYLSDAHAMIRYLARTEVVQVGALCDPAGVSDKIPHPQYPVPYAMYGHSIVESAEVDAWLDFVQEKLDTPVRLFSHREAHKQAGGSSFYVGEFRMPGEHDRKQLFANLAALERRIGFLKESRKALVQQSGGALTARHYLEEELLMYGDISALEESTPAPGTGPGWKSSRVASVYNVAGAIRSKMDEQDRVEKERQMSEIRHRTGELMDSAGGNTAGMGLDFSNLPSHTHSTHRPTRASVSSPRESSAVTPRMSILASARGGPKSARESVGHGVAGQVIQRQDLIFLVGDSLTAADLALAMALHRLYLVPSLKSEAVSNFSAVYRYYRSILMLPLAAEMRKALRINLA